MPPKKARDRYIIFVMGKAALALKHRPIILAKKAKGILATTRLKLKRTKLRTEMLASVVKNTVNISTSSASNANRLVAMTLPQKIWIVFRGKVD